MPTSQMTFVLFVKWCIINWTFFLVGNYASIHYYTINACLVYSISEIGYNKCDNHKVDWVETELLLSVFIID